MLINRWHIAARDSGSVAKCYQATVDHWKREVRKSTEEIKRTTVKVFAGAQG